MTTGDTIAAISSAVGPSARMILRLSGPEALTLSRQLSANVGVASAAGVCSVHLHTRELVFPATLYTFVAPHSYTGEDLVEFHIPGNPLLARMLLKELQRQGARLAEAGEFTARAYFNGRMNLSEAEGVAATIAAHSERELSAARQLLAGELARRLRPAMELLTETLGLVEVEIDFAEEDVTFLSSRQVRQRAMEVDRILEELVAQSSRFETLSHEPVFVLVGRPNAGKSTLLNALARQERAVVSPIEGTTRDAIWAEVPLKQGTIRLMDVAGLVAQIPDDEIAQQMHQQALRALEAADFVILVQEVTDTRPPVGISRSISLVVRTKSDLRQHISHVKDEIAVSAVTGTNLDTLHHRLDELAFGGTAGSAVLALNARHLQAINDARSALARIDQQPAELAAMELREALDSLGSILGLVSPDDLLGRIFSQFCIGK